MGKFEIEVTVKLEESLKSLINTLFSKVQVNTEEQANEETSTTITTTNNEVTTQDTTSREALREEVKKLAMEKRSQGHNISEILKNLGFASFRGLTDEKLEVFKAELEKL